MENQTPASIKRNCRDCGKEFELNEETILRLSRYRAPLPKTCRECRRLKKIEEGIGEIKRKISGLYEQKLQSGKGQRVPDPKKS